MRKNWGQSIESHDVQQCVLYDVVITSCTQPPILNLFPFLAMLYFAVFCKMIL